MTTTTARDVPPGHPDQIPELRFTSTGVLLDDPHHATVTAAQLLRLHAVEAARVLCHTPTACNPFGRICRGHVPSAVARGDVLVLGKATADRTRSVYRVTRGGDVVSLVRVA